MKKILSITMTFLVLSLIVLMPSYASASNITIPKILLIVNDLETFDESVIQKYEGKYEVVDIENLESISKNFYTAYAAPSTSVSLDKNLNKMLKSAFYQYESKIYLYGELTIADYKSMLDIDNFGAYVDALDKNGVAKKKVYQHFSDNQEQMNIENIISYSISNSNDYLIAKVAPDDGINTQEDYLEIILNDFEALGEISTASTIGVATGFNFRSYWGDYNYINMDYTLYKETDETISGYDYFALVTNLTAETNGQISASSIEAKHSLVYDADEMIDYGPGDISNAGQVSVGLDLSGGSVSGGLSYSFEVNGNPDIEATYSASEDYCSWVVKRGFLAGGIQNNLFKLGTSWASTGTYAKTNVEFRGELEANGYEFFTPWEAVEIIYDY